MVRREGIAAGPAGEPAEEGMPCCTVPAGEGPVRVIAGEPGSRPAPEAETPTGEAWCRKPSLARASGGEQQRGPQHQVKPAASTEEQSESRAEHVAAKAMQSAGKSGYAPSLGGVRGAARAEGTMWNTRGPSAPPTSGKGRSYKPKAKSSVVQRESEGVVVLTRAATNNAAGGKDPCSGHAGGVRKGWGMSEESRTNNPRRPKPDDQSREGQHQLWEAAESPASGTPPAEGPARRTDARRVAGAPWQEGDASCSLKITVKPYAGNRHVRFERRRVETGRF